MVLLIDTDRCDGCGACSEVCPTGALAVEGGVAILTQALCRECEVCVSACPKGAIITVYEPEREEAPLPQVAGTRALQPRAKGPSRVIVLAARALPWLGAAAMFVGREILPRVATVILESWERDAQGDISAPDHAARAPVGTPDESGALLGTTGGRQRHRQRHGRLGGGRR